MLMNDLATSRNSIFNISL